MPYSHFEISKTIRQSSYSMLSPHSHSYYEMYYLSKGSCTLLIADNLYNIEEGTITFIPEDTIHKTTYTGDSVCERLSLEFTSDWLSYFIDISPDWIDNNLCNKIMYISEENRNDVNLLFDNILHDHTSTELFSSILKKLHFQELVIALMRYCKSSPELLINNNVMISDKIINEAINYISQNYHNPITLSLLAKHLHLNASYFSKKFKTVCGVGFKDYLNHYRINHAERLLLETKKTITEIAFECGYENSNYFGDAFRKIDGISPTDFRKTKGIY